MSIYKELLDAVDNGAKFKVDLTEKSLWINKKQIIKKGEICHDKYYGEPFIKKWDLSLHIAGISADENPWELIEWLYQEYKHSVPKENTQKSYFKALMLKDLTDKDLAYNYDRDFANAMLSGYILLAGLQGWLKWQNDDHWFWQSQKDLELVILKHWIER